LWCGKAGERLICVGILVRRCWGVARGDWEVGEGLGCGVVCCEAFSRVRAWREYEVGGREERDVGWMCLRIQRVIGVIKQ